MRAFITGVTGQDGSYLAEHLIDAGHEVYGLVRGHNYPRIHQLRELVPTILLIQGDLLDQSSLVHALKESRPEVVYNLGALTFVGMSWQQPALMSEVTGLGVLRLLEAIRQVDPEIRLVHASSSEQFGSSAPPQDETTRFWPRSPYGVAKLMAHHTVVNYRESYGMFASTAIMFNHTSVRRGEEFVERKITSTVARIRSGSAKQLRLGNMDSYRDWGWAPDYMRGMEMIANHSSPDDFVLATGEMHSVRELVVQAFNLTDLPIDKHLVYDETLERPADVEALQGDYSKAERILGWGPTLRFDDIVLRLVAHDWEHYA